MVQVVNLVVAGPSDAGKTTFIQSLRDREDNLTIQELHQHQRWQRRGMHMEIDRMYENFGRIQVKDDLVFDLYAAPSRTDELPADVSVEHLWEILCEGAMGIILLVDSQQTNTFNEVRYTINKMSGLASVPLIVAANKQDLPGAASVETLRAEIGLEESIKILPCVATEHYAAQEVLFTLVGAILEENTQEHPVTLPRWLREGGRQGCLWAIMSHVKRRLKALWRK